VLVRSYYAGGTGRYGLTVNGLSAALKFCVPVISGARLRINGVGGSSGTDFILYSSADVAKPLDLWTSVLTNHFDASGACQPKGKDMIEQAKDDLTRQGRYLQA
jgi:hypothetical protein